MHPINFNPRTRVGCDIRALALRSGVTRISIHAPGWGATSDVFAQVVLSLISIHAPGWGATLEKDMTQTQAGISIHAPGWGATHPLFSCQRVHSDFNPRTRVGCDKRNGKSTVHCNYFNPRTRVGCDIRVNHRVSVFLLISIHAPGWGATLICICLNRSRWISIHAPGWGATVCGYAQGASQGNFNPRTRVGCDIA